MARLWKKSLLLATSMVLPTFALTACAGDSQYGTVASVSFEFTNSSNQTNNDNFDFSKKYGFNNWNDSNLTYQQNGSNWASYTSTGYVKSLSDMVISLGQFVGKLVTASLVGFKGATTDIPPIFSNGTIQTSDKSNDQFLQFLYAASNSLNFGQNGQLGFGLIGITTDIDGGYINPQVNGNVRIVDFDKNNKKLQLGYTNDNANVTFTFKFGYWNSGNDNPTSNGDVSVSDVENYANSVWSQKFSNYYTSFDIKLNLEAHIQSVFDISNDFDNFVNNAATAGYQNSDEWNNGDFLYEESSSQTKYLLSSSVISSYFKIKSDSNFSSFKLHLSPNIDSTNSSFLEQFATYDPSSKEFDDNYSTTFNSEFSDLSKALNIDNKPDKNLSRGDFTGFTDALSFVYQ